MDRRQHLRSRLQENLVAQCISCETAPLLAHAMQFDNATSISAGLLQLPSLRELANGADSITVTDGGCFDTPASKLVTTVMYASFLLSAPDYGAS